MIRNLYLELYLIISFVLLVISVYWTRREKHLLRIFGWLSIGIYYLINIPEWLGFKIPVILLFIYPVYHEYLSYKYNKDHNGLKFFAGVAGIAGVIFYLFDDIPMLAGYLVEFTGRSADFIANAIGDGPYLNGTESVNFGGNPWYFRDQVTEVSFPLNHERAYVAIVIGCSALNAMTIAGAVSILSTAPLKNRIIAGLISVPTIFFSNIFRIIITVYYKRQGQFEFAHEYVDRVFAILVLLAVLLVMIKLMPDFLENLMSLFDLHKRSKKG